MSKSTKSSKMMDMWLKTDASPSQNKEKIEVVIGSVASKKQSPKPSKVVARLKRSNKWSKIAKVVGPANSVKNRGGKTTPKKLKQRKVENVAKSKIVVKDAPEFRWFPNMVRKTPPNLGAAEVPKGDDGCLKGLKFVMTGTLNSLERENAVDIISKYGGRVMSAISGLTNYLIKGGEAGPSKLKKAADKKVKIIDEDGLFDLIRKNSPITAKILKSEEKYENTEQKKSLKRKHEKVEKKMEIEQNVVKKEDNLKNQNTPAEMEPDPNRKPKPPIKFTPSEPHEYEKVKQGIKPLSEKWRPKTAKEVVGNSQAVLRLQNFLKNFSNQHVGRKTAKKAALLSGPPGIGKTSSVLAVARDLGLEVIEMNASDTRSKKAMDKTIKASFSNRSVRSFFGSDGKKRVGRKKKVILMEEVDGMSSGDYGGVPHLIKFIKETEFPIICTCNERTTQKLKTLTGYCLDIQFVKPTVYQITPRLKTILEEEKIEMSDLDLMTIINRSNYDLRNILNTIEFQRSVQVQGEAKLSSNKVKDESLNQWEAATKLFSNGSLQKSKSHIDEMTNCYFVDNMFVPLLVQENYLSHRLTGSNTIDQYAKAADLLSESDLVNEAIYSEQNFALMPLHAMLSCIAPASIVAAGVKPFRTNFPLWLGKNSGRNKNKRLLAELKSKLNARVALDTNSLAIDQAQQLVHFIMEPLLAEGKDGIDETMENLRRYGMDKESLDFLSDLIYYETNSVSIKLPMNVKSALTRRYNSMNKTAPKAEKARRKKVAAKKKKGKKKVESEDGGDYEMDSFLVGSDEEEEEVRPVKKKSKAKKKTASGKERKKDSRGRGKKKV